MIRKLLGATATIALMMTLTACDDSSKNTSGNPQLEKPREQTSAPIQAPGSGVEVTGKADSR